MTYSAKTFEVATSNGLGGDKLTRNVVERQVGGRRADFGTKVI